jgi:hypothetical protein
VQITPILIGVPVAPVDVDAFAPPDVEEPLAAVPLVLDEHALTTATAVMVAATAMMIFRLRDIA